MSVDSRGPSMCSSTRCGCSPPSSAPYERSSIGCASARSIAACSEPPDVAVEPCDPALEPGLQEPQLGAVAAAGDGVGPGAAVEDRPAAEVRADLAAAL